MARARCAKLTNAKFKKANVYALPLLDNSFDLVISKDSFHHFDKPETALKEMWRVLKPGGLLYIQDLRRDLPAYILKTALPRENTMQKLQYYSTRASYTKEEIKVFLSNLENTSQSQVTTKNLTKKLKARYAKQGIAPESLRLAWQSRYVAWARKR